MTDMIIIIVIVIVVVATAMAGDVMRIPGMFGGKHFSLELSADTTGSLKGCVHVSNFGLHAAHFLENLRLKLGHLRKRQRFGHSVELDNQVGY